MSTNDPESHPSSRPGTFKALALVICVLGLGEAFCAGFLPDMNAIGILLGVILLLCGIAFWFGKKLWRKEVLSAYLNFLAGALFLIMAVNGALGLGIAEYKVQPLFVGVFVVVGLVFFFLGWLLLKNQSRN